MNKSKSIISTLVIFATLIISSCSKEVVKPSDPFLGTYVGTYNSGAGTANGTYSYEFLNSTDMNVYDGTVATGKKATGKYTKTGTVVTGFYNYPGGGDSIKINASMPNETTYILTGTWTINLPPRSGQFTVTKQ
jgi:hypothetical protein